VAQYSVERSYDVAGAWDVFDVSGGGRNRVATFYSPDARARAEEYVAMVPHVETWKAALGKLESDVQDIEKILGEEEGKNG
jgi:hypothetical protein